MKFQHLCRLQVILVLGTLALSLSKPSSSLPSQPLNLQKGTKRVNKNNPKKKVLKKSKSRRRNINSAASSASLLDQLDDIENSFFAESSDAHSDFDLQSFGGNSDDGEVRGGNKFDMDFESDDFDSQGNNPVDDDAEYGEQNFEGSEKGALYDAYNLLHTLAQDFEKPFDAPAVVVVGHQSSGKSALIEALMGFQFNQVGGGTKTRRPIALRMQYNPQCIHPRCFLHCDDGVERPKSMSEIQDYIQAENTRLERDPVRCFDPREINIRMEYKYCPNMILIDTPGLIAAPKIPRGRSGASGAVSMQQRALLKSAREAERLVVNKMKCQDYIILCVEDTMDWKHGATREIVQKADSDLSRTVIVNTKLDTKIPQFGTPSDVCDFLRAQVIDNLSPHKLGGPFFSSVPSGRVGRPEDIKDGASFDDFLFMNDDDFVAACVENEEGDRAVISQRLKNLQLRSGEKSPPISAGRALLPRVGLSRLRGFLERRVDECYRRNVAKIVPMLQAEYESCKRRLDACEQELEAISIDRLKQGADAFCDEFCAALKETIQGSVIAPPSVFGETLEQESGVAGTFQDIPGCPMAVTDRSWMRLVATEVGNQNSRLYGGAQYHRVMREFNLATRCLRMPTISEDEIANAAGMGTNHDGVNFLRAACVISLEKARTAFDPLLEALRLRMTHVMGRNCPVSEYMLNHKKERAANSYGYTGQGVFGMDSVGNRSKVSDITQNTQFLQLVRTIYDKFVQECSERTMMRCHDDLNALTRFVTWDMHERSSGALQRSLPDQTDIVSIYQVAVKAATKTTDDNEDEAIESNSGGGKTISRQKADGLKPVSEISGNVERDYHNLLQLMEEAACTRNAGRTNMVVGSLVQHVVSQWTDTFSRTVTTKFNFYFLLPFVEEFHKYLRLELQRVYEGEGELVGDVFDLTAARRALQQKRQDLMSECQANIQLQAKFAKVTNQMRREQEKPGEN